MYKIALVLFALIVLSSCSKSLSKKEVEKYTIQGKEITQATAKKLGVTLVEKMKDGGVKDAVPFCNTKAIPLTEEMSSKFNVTIKRTSHLLRNQDNKPNDEEVVVIDNYRDLIKKGKGLKPVVELDNNGNPHFMLQLLFRKSA